MLCRARPVSASVLPRASVAAPALQPVRHMKAESSSPVVEEWMVGRQREEAELEMAGVGGFNDTPATGPFGTLDHPVKIYSSFNSRIVGCKGGDDVKHRLLWFQLHAGRKHMCNECGQIFKLVTPADEGVAQAH